MAKDTTPAQPTPPDPFKDARQRIGELGDRVRAAKDAGALRAACIELGEAAQAVVGQVDRLAKTSSGEVWPKDMNAPEGEPGWGQDPKGVRGG